MPNPAPIAISERARRLATVPYPAADTSAAHGPTVRLPQDGIAAALDALDRQETHYTDRPGIAPLRSRIAAMLSKAGLPVTESDVVVTCGIEEARFVAMTVLVRDSAICGEIAALRPLAGLCGATLATSAPVVWSTAAAPMAGGSAVAVFEIGTPVGADVLPQGVPGAAGTVLLGELPGAGLLRTGFLACAGVDAKSLRDFKQALTICTANLSQWISLGLMGATDAA